MRRGDPRSSRRGAAARGRFAALAMAALTGCASPTPSAAPAPNPPPPPASLAPAVREREDRLGIEVRQWLVEADPARLASTIAAWADETEEPVAEATTGDADPPGLLLEEGVSIAQGPASELVAVLTALGGTRTDLRVWHGQAIEWRDLVGANLARSTIAIAGGRPLAIPAGRLALQLRGWVQPMEAGAACEIEIAVRWKPRRRASIGLDPAVGDAATWLGDLAVLRSIGRGDALLVVAAPGSAGTQGGGPPVETPPTLGELVLAPPAPGLATVLVIWPSLPDWLHPASETSASETTTEVPHAASRTEDDA